jgi:hypothetical protein
MNVFRSCVIVVVFYQICCTNSFAEDLTWKKNLKVLQQQQSLINSLECKYINEGDGGKTSLYMELIWKYVNQGYYYSIAKKNIEGQEKKYLWSYDGERGYALADRSDQLLVKGSVFDDRLMEKQFGFFASYDFLRTDRRMVTLDSIKGLSTWDNLKNRSIDISEESKNPNGNLTLWIKGSFDPFLKVSCNFKVIFSKQHNYLPIKYEVFEVDNDKKPIRTYEAKVIEKYEVSGKFYFYASKYKVWRGKFGGKISGPTASQYLGAEREIVLNEILFNKTEIGDCAIDPTLARSIYDLDAKKVMLIPK